MTATQAARSFSQVLNRVAAGEEIEVSRNGAPVAIIRPARRGGIPMTEFLELIGAGAGTLDENFRRDAEAIELFSYPEDPWESSSTPGS